MLFPSYILNESSIAFPCCFTHTYMYVYSTGSLNQVLCNYERLKAHTLNAIVYIWIPFHNHIFPHRLTMMVACCVIAGDQPSVRFSISPREFHFPVHISMYAVNCTYTHCTCMITQSQSYVTAWISMYSTVHVYVGFVKDIMSEYNKI